MSLLHLRYQVHVSITFVEFIGSFENQCCPLMYNVFYITVGRTVFCVPFKHVVQNNKISLDMFGNIESLLRRVELEKYIEIMLFSSQVLC